MHLTHTILLVLLLFCQIVGLALFLRGFFPFKKAIQGRATNDNLPPEPSAKKSTDPLSPMFRRVVIMLIDALRADFVFSEKFRMPFTQEIIRNNKSFSFLAKAHPPTVTMPRIKALTTGGIPGFIDVIFNADSKFLQLEDNVISQMKFAGKKLIFYGDDTWIKLFPEHFIRTDGTTSFFVTDYTEVDNNVTRHINKELRSNDWDIMILHYLGLDHIGHIAGPSSPLVGPKLLEMDQVVGNIYREMLTWDQQAKVPSLLVLCGDHGMSDAGSHGGASSAETSTPLVFMSSLFEQVGGEVFSMKQVQQIDLVPTLSLLLGLPIPQNSMGITIPSLLRFHSPREMLRALQLNTHQLSKTLIANGHSVDSMWESQHAHKLHSDWLKSEGLNGNIKNLETMAGRVAKQYILALEKMSGHMSALLSNYDLHAMICGIAVLVQTLYWGACGLFRLSFQEKTEDWLNLSATSVFILSGSVLLVAILHLLACSSTVIGGSDILCSANGAESILYPTVFAVQTGVTITSITCNLARIVSSQKSPLSPLLPAFSLIFHSRTRSFLVTGILLHTFSLLSSSFVEEEHQAWYFFTSTLFIVIFCERNALFCSRKNCNNSKLHERNACPWKISEDQTSQICRNVKSFDCDQDSRNTEFNKNRDIFTDVHLDGVTSNKAQNVKTFGSKCENSAGKATEIVATNPRILWHCFDILVLLGLGRLSRVWNQTGIKWADIPDFGDWLVKPENKAVLSIIYSVSLLLIICFRCNRQDFLTSVMFIIGTTHAYLYRTVTGNLQLPWLQNEPITKGISEARFSYCCVATMMVWNVIRLCKTNRRFEKGRDFKEYIHGFYGSLEGLLSSLLLLEVLLQRPHNTALLAVFVVQEHLMNKILWKSQETPWVVIVSSLWMGHTMYFSLGNSNSLASVDISAGYVGMEDFVPGIMVPLTYVATYCGPCLWLIAGVLSIIRNVRDVTRLRRSLCQVCYVIILCQSLVLCVYCTLVFGQRYHLFVWSVFSPKLLYETMKTLLCSLSVVSVLCLMHFVQGTKPFFPQKTE